MQEGLVIKLDRGFPLVRLESGQTLRCEHNANLKKTGEWRCVVGDRVLLTPADTHDKGIIEQILPRTRALTRKDPTERALPQVLAANFDQVIVAQPLGDINIRRLERELVLANETQAQVSVVLTKADLLESDQEAKEIQQHIQAIAGPQVAVFAISTTNPESIEEIRRLIPPGNITVLMGKSGVGKSSLVNMLLGHEVQAVTEVRDDGKGRHTTVSREMLEVPGGGFIVDMPGVRGLGLWDAEEGIGATFADIEELAQSCRFRDCKHTDEPGCAVLAALESGELASERYLSYQGLCQEMNGLNDRREQARRLRGEKASDAKAKQISKMRKNYKKMKNR